MHYLKKKYLLNLFCISLVLGSTLRFYKLYLLHIIIVVFLFLIKFKRPIFQRNLTSIFLFTTIGWYSITIFWAESKIDVIKYLLYILICSAIPIILNYSINSMHIYKKVFKFLGLLFFFEIIVCLFEITIGLHLPTSPYSHTRLYQTSFEENYSPLIANSIKYVPTGFHHNPNDLALTIACIIPFFLVNKNYIKRFLFTIIGLTIIICAGSRGVFLAFIFGYLFNSIVYKPKFIFLQIIISVIVFSMTICFLNQEQKSLIVGFTENIKSSLVRYVDFSESSNESIGYRKQLIKNGLDSLNKKSVLLGVGGGNSGFIQTKYEKIGNNLTSMHNFWVEVLVDSGLIYFTLLLFWYFFICYKILIISFKCRNLTLKTHAQALLISLVIFFIGCISASSVIYHFPMWLMFAWALIIIKLSQKQKGKEFYNNVLLGIR